MTSKVDDYLWDPNAEPDANIEEFERMLAPMSARARKLEEHPLPIPRRAIWQRIAAIAACVASVFLGLYAVHAYRLSWEDGRPWSVTTIRANGLTRELQLRVGEILSTGPSESAVLSAARIGTLTIAPHSLAQITRTRTGLHRVELERGHLHAKVWAPPNHFGITHGEMRFTDLGCEFDLKVDAAAEGTLAVTSGWVIYRFRDEEILVPENYVLTFGRSGADVPLRRDAPEDFAAHVVELDAKARMNDRARVAELSRFIDSNARDEDYFTLLNLLIRHPALAEGPLYARLASALNVEPDESHRARWARGEAAARDQWWQRIPEQPKTWWLKWRDAF